MQALKGLVIGLGALIVLGMVFLVVGLYHKASNPNFRLFSDDETPAAAAPPVAPASTPTPLPTTFGDLTVTLPAGCRLTGVTPAGRTLYLLSDCDHVTVLDLDSGRILGTVSVKR